jgi:menaquinone-dependent protoporphyrinogen IX oxidase
VVVGSAIRAGQWLPEARGFVKKHRDYSHLALLPRLIVRAMKTPEGDFRNWDAIAAWADRLHHEMLAGA